jgi:hypothetical protein
VEIEIDFITGSTSGPDASRGDVGPGNTEPLTARLSEDAPLPPTGNENDDPASRRDQDPESLTARLSEDAPLPPTGNENDDPTVQCPSTPPSQPNIMIDPSLLETPGLDTSMLTLTSPPVPHTPDRPGPSLQCNSSPLSHVSDGGTTTERARESIGLKRKRTTSTANRPRAKARRKAARV